MCTDRYIEIETDIVAGRLLSRIGDSMPEWAAWISESESSVRKAALQRAVT